MPSAEKFDDEAFKERVLSRWFAQRPPLFDVIFEAAAEARLSTLRCEALGVAAFKLWRDTHGDGERFAQLLAERVPVTTYLAFAVEGTQPTPAPTE